MIVKISFNNRQINKFKNNYNKKQMINKLNISKKQMINKLNISNKQINKIKYKLIQKKKYFL